VKNHVELASQAQRDLRRDEARIRPRSGSQGSLRGAHGCTSAWELGREPL